MTCLGMDVGHSSVKLSWRGPDGKVVKLMIPSVVIPAMRITDKTAADTALDDTVDVAGNTYFIGNTALHEVGNLRVSGLHDRWLDMKEFRALVQGAIDKVTRNAGKIERIVTGLPASTFHEQQLKMRNIVSACLDTQIRVLPEPNGIYLQHMIGLEGGVRKDRVVNAGIVAIGRYTTDFMALLDGRWVEGVAGSCSGMSRAANLLLKQLKNEGLDVDYLDADDALWKREIRNYGRTVDVSRDADRALSILGSEIFDSASARFGDVGRKLVKIFVGGGGADLLIGELTEYWPQAELVEDPRFAVAEGFRRLGESL